jgi:antitoxin component YwqK of YwqJK toxin-antitoxin module
MRVQAEFVNGKKEGLETAWNKDGSVRYQTNYVNGNPVTPAQP